MSDQFFWYVTRSAALVSWLSASLSLLVGLVTSSRLLGRRPTIPWLVDLHRLLAAMAVMFLGVHMLSLWLDGYVQFGPAELLIPWVATVPGLSRTSIALGVIAAWLLAAVQVTSLIKDRLPDNVWRTIHLSSFGTLAAGTIHAIQVGSDTENPLVVGIGVSMLTAIALAAAVRVLRLRTAPRAPQTGPARRTASKPGAAGPTRRRTSAPRGAAARAAAANPADAPRRKPSDAPRRKPSDAPRRKPSGPTPGDPGSARFGPGSRRSGTRPGAVRRSE